MTPPIGQWVVAPDGGRWWFDSGSIALDFVYTGSIGPGPGRETWNEPADAARWLKSRFGARLRLTEADLGRAIALRTTVASLVVAACAGDPLPPRERAVLDRQAAMPDIPPQIGRPVDPTLDQ